MNGEDLANELKSMNYSIKKYNSKSVWVSVEDRQFELENLKHRLSDYDCYHDPNLTGSSVGGLVVNGVKVYLKTNNYQNMMNAESIAIATLDDRLKQAYKNNTDITIVLDNGKELKNPIGVVKTIGNPKSDFYMFNRDGDELHISHKKGKTPAHFQQWSGMSEQQISSNHYAMKFQQEMQRSYKELNSGDAIAMKIPDNKSGTELKLMALYGVDCIKTETSGPNKVDCLMQGIPVLDPQSDGVFRLTTDTNSIYSYPAIPSGSYEPVMCLTYRSDRSNMGIKGARASIYPIGGRNFHIINK